MLQLLIASVFLVASIIDMGEFSKIVSIIGYVLLVVTALCLFCPTEIILKKGLPSESKGMKRLIKRSLGVFLLISYSVFMPLWAGFLFVFISLCFTLRLKAIREELGKKKEFIV